MRSCLPVVLVLALTGCSDVAPATADCERVVRSDGIDYRSAGWTDAPAEQHGTAVEALCHDVGPDAPGTVVTDDSPAVVVWAFPDLAADRVLAVREGGRFALFVAAAVGEQERERIYATLASAAGDPGVGKR
jgi:hypothetical protein